MEPNTGERPQPQPWETVRERALLIVDETGRVDFDRLSEEQRMNLGDITVRTLKGEEVHAPDITDPTVERLPQQPHHLVEDDLAFIAGKNNFHTGFRWKQHFYNPFDYMPYWHRFKTIAPELFARLEQVESDRNVHDERTPENIEALRAAYLIASQLVCREDPNLYSRHPDNTLAM